MKNQLRNLVIGAGLTALLWSPIALAQTKEMAEIPFDFHAGKVTLPAGSYAVTNMSSNGVIHLRNEDTHQAIVMLAPTRDEATSDARLIFHRYGNSYFLSSIEMPGIPVYRFWKSSAEKEMESAGMHVTNAYVQLARR